jgi:hypothetical protein
VPDVDLVLDNSIRVADREMFDVKGIDPSPVGVDGVSRRHEALRTNDSTVDLRAIRRGRRVEDIVADRIDIQQWK